MCVVQRQSVSTTILVMLLSLQKKHKNPSICPTRRHQHLIQRPTDIRFLQKQMHRGSRFLVKQSRIERALDGDQRFRCKALAYNTSVTPFLREKKKLELPSRHGTPPFSFGIVLLIRSVLHVVVASQAHELGVRVRRAEVHGGQVAPLLCRARRYQGCRDWCETGAALHERVEVERYTARRGGNRHPGHIQRGLHEGRRLHRLEGQRVRPVLRLRKQRQGIQSVVVVEPDRQ